MKIRALMSAGLMIAALTAPSFAFDNSTGANSGSAQNLLAVLQHGSQGKGLVQHISCNTNDEDKQAYCMRKCEEAFVDSSEQYHVTQEDAQKIRKDCETKCGC